MTPAQPASWRRAESIEQRLIERFAACAKPSVEFDRKLWERIRALSPAPCKRMRYDGGQH